MSVICVNLNSPEVRKLAGELGIHPTSLEECIHEYWNSPYGLRYFSTHGDYPFPSTAYVREYFFGGNTNVGEVAIRSWARSAGRRHYGELYNGQPEYIALDIAKYTPIVGSSAIHVFRGLDGSRVFKVARPKLRNVEDLLLLLSELKLVHKWGSNKYRLTKNSKISLSSVVDSFNKALKVLDIDLSNFTLRLEGNTVVVEFNPEFSEINDSSLSNQTLFQKADLLQQIIALKAYRQPLSGKGSLKNITTFIKGLKGIDNLIKNVLIKAVEEDITLSRLSPYDLWNLITKQRDVSLAKDYNTYIQNPIDEKLEQHLIEFLKPYHIDVKESGIAETYGVAGAFDIINKTIHLAKNRNAITMTEEFAHAFVELMGSVVSKRPENKDFSFLYDHVEETDIYSLVYEQYKDVYVTAEGTPDIYKIKKEAIGQALAVAINNKWNHTEEKATTFWEKLKEWFDKILDMFSGAEYLDFNALITKIATEVVNNDYSRLQKVDATNYSLLNYADTIARQNEKDGGKALRFMQYFSNKGNIITGSISYRKLGTVYRGALDALHDIDMKVPKSTHGIDIESPAIKGIISRLRRKDPALVNALKQEPYFKLILEDIPNLRLLAGYPGANGSVTINAIYSEDMSLVERFAALNGSYAQRLDAFTEEERSQIYLFDFFLETKDIDFITDEENKINLSFYDESFSNKVKMGRAKDIFDYQMFNIFEDYKAKITPHTETMMFQKGDKPFEFNPQQVEAIEGISDWLLKENTPEPFCVIRGVAGSGKTTIINEIINAYYKKGGNKKNTITVCAVANTAVENLSSKVKAPHKDGSCAAVLDLIEVGMYDPTTDSVYEEWIKNPYSRGQTSNEEQSCFAEAYTSTKILIVDECSMLNEQQLQYFLLAKEEIPDLKIIFIGDERLAPVIRPSRAPEITDTPSPTFTTSNRLEYRLTERVRQGKSSPVPTYSDIMGNFVAKDDIHITVQENPKEFSKEANKVFEAIKNTETVILEGGALCVYNDKTIGCSPTVIDLAVPIFRLSINTGNLQLGKIACAHVDAVFQYNELIQKRLYPNDSRVIIHENNPLILYSPWGVNRLTGLPNSTEMIATLVLAVQEDNYKEMQDYLETRYPKFFTRVPPIKYQRITAVIKRGGDTLKCSLLAVVPDAENLKNYEKLIKQIKECKDREAELFRKKDKGYALMVLAGYLKHFKVETAHTYFDYAISVHKSLGSTYDTVIVDTADILGSRMPNPKIPGRTLGGFSPISLLKLLYTGITRASNVTMMVGDFPKATPIEDDPISINNLIRSFKGLPSIGKGYKLKTDSPKPDIKATDTSAGMKAATLMWDSIFKTLNDRNEKIDTEEEHSYYYYPSGKEHPETKVKIDTSVTTVINPPSSDSPYLEVASRIGSTTDLIIREFFAGEDILLKQYPNFNLELLKTLHRLLIKLRESFDEKFHSKQYKVVSLENPIISLYQDSHGQWHTVGGTIDLLIYDEDGNYYIYDIKTSRSSISSNENKLHHYSSLVNSYRLMLEAQFPQLKGKCKGLGIIELNTSYPAPKGARLKGGVISNANYAFDHKQIELEGVDIQDYKGHHTYKAPELKTNPFISIEETVPDEVLTSKYNRETRAIEETYSPISFKSIETRTNVLYGDDWKSMASEEYEDDDVDDIFETTSSKKPDLNAIREDPMAFLKQLEEDDIDTDDVFDTPVTSSSKAPIVKTTEAPVASNYSEPSNNKSTEAETNSVPDKSTSTNVKVSDVKFTSGAAQGSDSFWAEEAKKLHFLVEAITGAEYIELSQEEKIKINKEYIEARGFIQRPVLRIANPKNPNDPGILTRRDIMQADNADAIFAVVLRIAHPGEEEKSGNRSYVNNTDHDNVEGGTGNAVARGIIRNIPVYVFDLSDKTWKAYNPDTKRYESCGTPTLTPKAAVIGTKEINEDGQNAIIDVLSSYSKILTGGKSPVLALDSRYTILKNSSIFGLRGKELADKGFEVTYVTKKSKDGKTENEAVLLSIKGSPEKGWFEVVRDRTYNSETDTYGEYNEQFSIHFKTKSSKANNETTTASVPLTDEEKDSLFNALVYIIPDGTKGISTWGELTKGGIHALNTLDTKSNGVLFKIGTRELKDKEGNLVTIPIYSKQFKVENYGIIPKYELTNTLDSHGRLSSSKLNETGSNAIITLHTEALTVDNFFTYLTGAVESDVSSLRKEVLKRLEPLGYTEDYFKSLIRNKGEISAFLLFLEKAHIKHNTFVNYSDSNIKDILISEQLLLLEVNSMLDAIREYESWKLTPEGQAYNPISTISRASYNKETPSTNRDAAFMFGENALFALTAQHLPLPKEVEAIEIKDLNVGVGNKGTNLAVIRTDKEGVVHPNSCGIIVKKFAKSNGRFVMAIGNFKDTDEDFELFKKLNLLVFAKARQFNSVVWPDKLACNKAALPERFAKWLQDAVKIRFGISTTILPNTKYKLNGYGLQIEGIEDITVPTIAELVIPRYVQGQSAAVRCANTAKEINGVNTLRIQNSSLHFGNPFSVKRYPEVLIVCKSVAESVIAYEQWLRGTAYKNIDPTRRKWILDLINSGALDGKPIVYYTSTVDSLDGTDYFGNPSSNPGKYSYASSPNHAHILLKLIQEHLMGKLIGIESSTTKPVILSNTEPMTPASFTNYSAGLYGAETFWDLVGRTLGFTSLVHYTPKLDGTVRSATLKKAGVVGIPLSTEQCKEAANYLNKTFRFNIKPNAEGVYSEKDLPELLSYWKIKNADAVFAIAELNGKGNHVSTEECKRAIYIAKRMNKSIFVWDINTQHWMVYNPVTLVFQQCDTPILPINFAGIGAKNIENYRKFHNGNFESLSTLGEYKGAAVEKAAKKAIEDVYKATLARPKEILAEVGTLEVQRTINVLNSPNTFLEPEEVKDAEKKGIIKPRILIASEHSDPAFHAEEIKALIQPEIEKKLTLKILKELLAGAQTGEEKKDIQDLIDAIMANPPKFNMMYIITKHDGLPIKELALLDIPKYIHFSITGLGSTEWEPGVMKALDLLDRIEALLNEKVLNPNTTFIRIDPIVPGVTKMRGGTDSVEYIVKRATAMGITKLRFSIMDNYNYKDGTSGDRHISETTKQRIPDYDWSLYYNKNTTNGKDNFHAKQSVMDEWFLLFQELGDEYNVNFSACAETINTTKYPRLRSGESCINPVIVSSVLGTNNIDFQTGKHNRTGCKCGAGTDALSHNAYCKSSCTYCFAGHSINNPESLYDKRGRIKKNMYTIIDAAQTEDPDFDLKEEAEDEKLMAKHTSNFIKAIHEEVNPEELFKGRESDLELIKQRKALGDLSGTLFKPTEVRTLARLCMFELSDAITRLCGEEDYAKQFFPLDSKWRNTSFKDMSRMEVIKTVGLSVLLDTVRQNYFTPTSLIARGGSFTLKTKKKFGEITKNWGAFIEIAYSSLAELESISVTSMSLEKNSTTGVRTLNTGEDEIFDGLSAEEIAELTGSSVEHWQVGFRQLSAFSSLSQTLKRYVNSIKEVDLEGNPLVDSTYKMPIRLDSGKAVANILLWTLGATTLDEMVALLKAQEEKFPWVKLIVEDLGENGKDETFKALFFSNFKKYYLPYMILYLDPQTNRLTMKLINAGNLEKEMAKQWVSTWLSRVGEGNVNLWELNKVKPMALYTQKGTIDTVQLSHLKNAIANLKTITEKIKENRAIKLDESENLIVKEALTTIYQSLDIDLTSDTYATAMATLMNYDNLIEILSKAHYLAKAFLDKVDKDKKAGIESTDWNPYTASNGEKSQRNTIETLFKMIANYSDLNLESVSYENGKMHYSYVIPSYLSKLLGKIQGNNVSEEEYLDFMEREYGRYKGWFKYGQNWRNEWLRILATDPEKRKQFQHAVLLSQETKKGDKLGYTDKSPISYERSMLANYFYADKTETVKVEIPLDEKGLKQALINAIAKKAAEWQEKGDARPLDVIKGEILAQVMAGTLPLEYNTKMISSTTHIKSGEYAYFHVPMMSNKPSEEYIHFIKYGVSYPDWKKTLIGHLLNVAEQEITRIASTEVRAADKNIAPIKNFDYDKKKGKKGNGQKFVFLEYLLGYLDAYDIWEKEELEKSHKIDFDTVYKTNDDILILGKLLREKIRYAMNPNGTPILSDLEKQFQERMLGRKDEEGHFIKGAIELGMDNRFNDYIKVLEKEGMITYKYGKNKGRDLSNFRGLNMGSTLESIMLNLENFFWNDTFASINILQLTVTDTAFYKDTEDLQKRLAQIHAPGLRAHIKAKDSAGNYVAFDGQRAISRTIYLTDFDNVVSDAIENIKNILYNRLNEMPNESESDKKARAEYEEIIKGLLSSFKEINVADALGYSSLTSYRKKAILFGKWGPEYEKMWLEFLAGGYKDSRLLRIAIQPLKPFIYSLTAKKSSGPMPLIKEGVQNKNSEYLLILMDAILLGEKDSGSCMLRAISEIMEESHLITKQGDHYVAGTGGIDTVLFESTVKAGLQSPINITPSALRKWESKASNITRWDSLHKDWVESNKGKTWRAKHPNHPIPDTEIAKLIIRDAIYINGDPKLGYDERAVHSLDYEDYCLQSEVPAHLEGDSIFGSQLRILGISDTPETDEFGNANIIKIGSKTMTVAEAKLQYMLAIKKNIEESKAILEKELAIDGDSLAERNVKLSQLLVKLIIADNKDGYDLLYAVTTDEKGNFLMPLNDPVIATRIQLLLNSIIKSRINKLEMKGGPVVQVTNFGAANSLLIRFLSKTGESLLTFKEFFEEATKDTKKYPALSIANKVEVNLPGESHATELAVKLSGALNGKLSSSVPKYTWDEFIEISKKEINFKEECERLASLFGSTTSLEYLNAVKELRDSNYLYLEVYKPIADAYLQYLENHNASIEYFECYAPSKVFAEEFPDCVDRKGNVNIEYFLDYIGYLEKHRGLKFDSLTQEEKDKYLENAKAIKLALEIIGYRIPTESKYSMAPLKIVGFLPFEAGEGIMLPKDITCLSGSDFDIDKLYIVRPEIKSKADEDEMRKAFRRETAIQYDTKAVWDAIYLQYPEITDLIAKALENWYKDYTAQGGTLSFNDAIADSNLTHRESKIDWLDAKTKTNYWKLYKDSFGLDEFALKNGKRFTWKEWELENRHRFIKISRPSDMESRLGRNNIIFDTLWGNLTNSLSATLIFTPGNFDLPKKYGYMAAVIEQYSKEDIINYFNKQGERGKKKAESFENKEFYDIVDSLSTDELKSMLSTSKNLVYNHVHLQFHKLNMVAGKLIGVFAQNNVSHSVISLVESVIKDTQGVISKKTPTMTFGLEDFMVIEGEALQGEVPFDTMYNKYGERISSTLAAFLAASVDAVKDPVLNYMNVNEVTAGVLTTLARLGYDTELAMMLLSRPIIKKLVLKYITLNETNVIFMNDVAKLLMKEEGLSEVAYADISKETLKKIINKEKEGKTDSYDDSNLIKAFMTLYSISRSTSNIVSLTKFNSVTAAIGPLITDTVAMEIKVADAILDPRLRSEIMLEALQNPIPLTFREATLGEVDSTIHSNVVFKDNGLGKELFENTFITASQNFRDAVMALNTLMRGSISSEANRSLLNKFSDFYIAFAINSIVNGLDENQCLFASEDNPNPLSTDRRNYLFRELPNIVDDIKKSTDEAKKKTANNLLIKAIDVKGLDNLHTSRWLTINTRAFRSDLLDEIKAAWYELWLGTEEERKLAMELVEYNYMIDCFGFNPTSFSKLIPVLLRNKIPNYTTNLKVDKVVNIELLLDLFIRNNHNLKALVLAVAQDTYKDNRGEITVNTELCPYVLTNDKYLRPYIKLPDGRLCRARGSVAEVVSSEFLVDINLKFVKYVEVEKLGGENCELIEFNPFGEASSIFTSKEQSFLQLHSRNRSATQKKVVTYRTLDLLIYFMLTHLKDGLIRESVANMLEALLLNDDSKIIEVLAEVLSSGHCNSISNFTTNMGDTRLALKEVVKFFNPENLNSPKTAKSIEKLILGIKNTLLKLKICL